MDVNTPIEQAPLPDSPKYEVTVFPNPFNSAAEIIVNLSREGSETISLFDVLGRKVATIHQGYLPNGRSRITLNGKSMSSGLYFIRLDGNHLSVCTRVLLLK